MRAVRPGGRLERREQSWPVRDARFAETVAVNAGGLFRLFEEPDDALAWLNGARGSVDDTRRP